MLKQRRSVLSLSMLIGASIVSISTAAIANDMSGTYSNYYESIYATELCRDTTIDAAGWKKLAGYIDNKVNHEIGAGERLTLIETAKSDARKLVTSKGCSHQMVQDLIKVYDSELASL